MSDTKRPICVVSHTSELYGAPRSMLSVIEAMQERGLQFKVVTFGRGGLTDWLQKIALPFQVIPVLRKIQTRRLSYRILRKLEKQVGGLFYAFRLLPILASMKPRLLYVNTVARSGPFLCAWLLKLPLVVHVRESSYYFRRRSLDDLIRVFLVSVVPVHYICVSKATADLLVAQGISADRMSVIHNGLDPLHYRFQGNPSTDNRVTVGFVGGLTNRKGIDFFLRMGLQLLAEGSNVRFLIVGGSTDSPRFRREILTLVPPDQRKWFEFTGFVEDVSNQLNRIDIFCMTSKKEPFARVNLEAMLFGIPVVAFDVGGNAEAVVDGETGFVVPEGQESDFVRAVQYLVTAPDARRAMGEVGQDRVLKLFTVEKYVSDTLAVISRFA